VFKGEFLRSLADRGLRGVKLIIAGDHKGLKGAAAKAPGVTVQHCRVHFMRNARWPASAKRTVQSSRRHSGRHLIRTRWQAQKPNGPS